MAKVLNEYLSSVLTMEKDMKTRELGAVNGNVLRTVHIMVEEGLDVLRHMKLDTSPGPGQIYQIYIYERPPSVL